MTDKQYRRTKTTSVDYTMHSSYLLCDRDQGLSSLGLFLNIHWKGENMFGTWKFVLRKYLLYSVSGLISEPRIQYSCYDHGNPQGTPQTCTYRHVPVCAFICTRHTYRHFVFHFESLKNTPIIRRNCMFLSEEQKKMDRDEAEQRLNLGWAVIGGKSNVEALSFAFIGVWQMI